MLINMIYITNATFLTYIVMIDPHLLKKIDLKSIPAVIGEVKNNIYDPYFDKNVDHLIGTVKGKKKPMMPLNVERHLSDIDKSLLSVALANKKHCLLVTDDNKVRQVAKINKIRTLITPTFIEYLTKKDEIKKENAIKLLTNLKVIYIRKNYVVRSIERLEVI